MIKLTLLFLLLSNIAFCQLNEKKASQLNQSIKPNHSVKGVITISGNLPKGYKVNFYTILGESGDSGDGLDLKNPVKIYTNSPVLVTTNWGIREKYTNEFNLFPGDSIWVVLDKMGKYKFTANNNPKFTNELSFYYDNPLFSNKYDYWMYPFKDKSYATLTKVSDSIAQARMNYLKDYRSTHPVSHKFNSTVSQWIKDISFRSIFWFHGDGKGLTDYEMRDFTDKLKQFFSQGDEDCTFEHKWVAFLFCKFLTINVLKLDPTPDNLFNTANKYLKGNTLDATLFEIINQSKYGITPTNVQKQFLTKYYTICKNPEFRAYIQSLAPKKKLEDEKKIIDGIAMLDKCTSYLPVLLEKYNGKTVYVNLWYSGSGSDLNEMACFEKLKKVYTNKGVVFINMSTNECRSEWLKKTKQIMVFKKELPITTNNTNPGINNEPILKSNNRFLLIDKAGRIVSKPASRPSDKDIKGLIDKYI